MTPFADVAGGYLVVAGLVFWARHICRRNGMRLRDLVGSPPTDRREWGWTALAFPLLAFGTTALVASFYALSFVAPGFVENVLLAPDKPSVFGGHPVLLTLNAAAAIAFGPIAEELFFRGALLQRWSARWGRRRGLVASAVAFGILHADPIGAVVFAACMSLLFWRTGTLLVPMACHILHNAIVTALDLFTTSDTAGQTLAEFRGFAWGMTLAFPVVAIVVAVAMRPLVEQLKTMRVAPLTRGSSA